MLRLFALVAVSLLSSTAFAQPRCTAIPLPNAGASTSIKGKAPSEVPFTCYTLATTRGQTVTLKIAKPSRDIAFNIGGVTDNQDSYVLKADAKTYHIDVYQMGRGSGLEPFTLQVSVK